MIKTVYFDLGNVLIFFSLPKMFSQMEKCTGIPPQQFQKLLFDTNLRELYEKGLIRTEEVYKTIQKQAIIPFTLSDFKTAYSEIFTPNTELFPLVEDLKKAGMRLILLSNTSESHFNYAYQHYPVLQLFDHKVLSFEVGAWKPDLHIFQEALKHSQCAPEDCFYTDDIPEFINSAKRVGLPGEVFTNVFSLKQQLIEQGCKI